MVFTFPDSVSNFTVDFCACLAVCAPLKRMHVPLAFPVVLACLSQHQLQGYITGAPDVVRWQQRQ